MRKNRKPVAWITLNSGPLLPNADTETLMELILWEDQTETFRLQYYQIKCRSLSVSSVIIVLTCLKSGTQLTSLYRNEKYICNGKKMDILTVIIHLKFFQIWDYTNDQCGLLSILPNTSSKILSPHSFVGLEWHFQLHNPGQRKKNSAQQPSISECRQEFKIQVDEVCWKNQTRYAYPYGNKYEEFKINGK